MILDELATMRELDCPEIPWGKRKKKKSPCVGPQEDEEEESGINLKSPYVLYGTASQKSRRK